MAARATSYKHASLLAFITISFIQINEAFLPKNCASSESLSFKECCPVPFGLTGKCGGPRRGRCVELQPLVIDPVKGFGGDLDRFQWPTQFVQRACNCLGNFDGADCSSCKFGWTGPNCDVPKTRTRRNILTMPREEVNKFQSYLHQAKDTVSDYMIPTTLYNDMDNGRNPKFNEINVYDEFVWMHYFAARRNLVKRRKTKHKDVPSVVQADFAHAGPAFLTWHRAYLLLWERALQKISGDEDFTIPYWDWAGERDCTVCTDKYVGGSDKKDHTLTGSFSNWRVLCHDFQELTEEGQLCSNDPDASTLPFVERNPGGDANVERQKLPTRDAMYYALSVRKYDNVPIRYRYLKNTWSESHCSFRNILEGFSDSENGTGLFIDGFSQLHNMVHGYMNGTIGSVPTASNDPLFLLHHSNVDRIFEKWLRRHRVARDEFPSKSTPMGHNRYSYMVPFFPVYTNDEFFQRSEHFGYTYDDIDSQGLPLDPIERHREEKAVKRMKKCQMPTHSGILDDGIGIAGDGTSVKQLPTHLTPDTSTLHHTSDDSNTPAVVGGVLLVVVIAAVVVGAIVFRRPRRGYQKI
ncbi:tyrosinase-like [Ptychodera flava]|uniref:tyrosinase-like n=1 Tax=Ptychodera flava TaxID=63121 RepID=UPI00396A0703